VIEISIFVWHLYSDLRNLITIINELRRQNSPCCEASNDFTTNSSSSSSSSSSSLSRTQSTIYSINLFYSFRSLSVRPLAFFDERAKYATEFVVEFHVGLDPIFDHRIRAEARQTERDTREKPRDLCRRAFLCSDNERVSIRCVCRASSADENFCSLILPTTVSPEKTGGLSLALLPSRGATRIYIAARIDSAVVEP
jgi:hypothetical protein